MRQEKTNEVAAYCGAKKKKDVPIN